MNVILELRDLSNPENDEEWEYQEYLLILENLHTLPHLTFGKAFLVFSWRGIIDGFKHTVVFFAEETDNWMFQFLKKLLHILKRTYMLFSSNL